MNTIDTTRTDVVVRPLRFTDHLAQMRDFLALLGFSTRISRDDSWVTMVGHSGEVALHAAATGGGSSGETGMMFEVPDADALAAQFVAAGFADVSIYDEAWGRVLRVRDRDAELLFDERPTDHYGYRVDEPRPAHRITSVTVLDGSRNGPLDGLLSAARFVRRGGLWEGTGGGLVDIRPDGPGTVRLALRTAEPLPDLAARLTAAGYPDVRLTEELTVTDPDGQPIVIARRPNDS